MKKILSLIYGIIAYIIFLVSFFYAIGFVGNFTVGKSIDSGTETTFMKSLLINALLLGLFAIQHSVMARPGFKKWWTGIIGSAVERSTYVLLSSLALLLMYWQWKPITGVLWKIENKALVVILNGVYFFGWLVVFLSTLMINHFELFGLRQVFENLRNKQMEAATFKVNFFYRIVRHPIMLGFLIAFWATPVMTLGHFIFTLTTTLYIVMAVKFLEERDLRKYYGIAYEQYQNSVPMILPFTGKANKSTAVKTRLDYDNIHHE